MFKKNLIIFDTETEIITPKSPFPIVFEVGAYQVDKSLDIVCQKQWMIKRDKISAEAEYITGITNAEIQTGIEPREFCKEFMSFCKDSYLCAFNLTFDLGVIYAEFARQNITCYLGINTLDLKTLASYVFDYQGMKVPSPSLNNFCKRLEISIERSHRALADVEKSHLLLKELLKLENKL